MAIIKFDPSDKIFIYRCDFDINDSNYKPVRETVKNQESNDEIQFQKHNCVFKFHLTEAVALTWAFDFNNDQFHRIYSDNTNHIFDVILYTCAVDLWEFNLSFFARDHTFTPKFSELKVEHLIYQDVDGHAHKRVLLSRTILQDPLTNIQTTKINSANCIECKDRKKIYLFSSEVDCDKCVEHKKPGHF